VLTPKAAEQIGLALHELGTNAAKYGALSVPAGTVKIQWDLEKDGPAYWQTGVLLGKRWKLGWALLSSLLSKIKFAGSALAATR
jgi:two-component sensor histidine kinase